MRALWRSKSSDGLEKADLMDDLDRLQELRNESEREFFEAIRGGPDNIDIFIGLLPFMLLALAMGAIYKITAWLVG